MNRGRRHQRGCRRCGNPQHDNVLDLRACRSKPVKAIPNRLRRGLTRTPRNDLWLKARVK